MSDREFDLLRALVHRESGIALSDSKKALLTGRLSRRLQHLGLDSFGAYYRRLTGGGERGEIAAMVDCVCTNETRFFREPLQFRFLEQRLLPQWRERAAAGGMPRRVRAWSAACSTGEEPYSLAMSLLADLPPGAGWEVSILATDISGRALAQARAAVWPLARAGPIPERHLRAFMLRGTGSQGGRMKAGPEIRSLVRFEQVNLNAPELHVPGPFDLILCRNVLIYFDAPTRARLVDRLLGLLAPGGHLFLGHAETLTGLSARVRAVGPTVYVRADGADR